MKLVLAPHFEAYARFIRAVDRKGRDTSQYIYIVNSGQLMGLPRDTKVIKVGAYREHPNYQQIIDECNARFDMTPQRRIGHGRHQGDTQQNYTMLAEGMPLTIEMIHGASDRIVSESRFAQGFRTEYLAEWVGATNGD